MANQRKQSEWIADAQYRNENRKWLRYSSNIARRIIAALSDNNELNQTLLAERAGVTPQYISNVVKGHENLSLKTIAKLSSALGIELISFPDYKYGDMNSSKVYVLKMNADEPSYSGQQSGVSNDFKIDESRTGFSHLSPLLTSFNYSETAQ